jgi:DNA-binding beta-propeller fold protein YncE
MGIALRCSNGRETVLVTEENNHRVSEFELEGTFIRTIGGEGCGPGQLDHPYDVTILPGSGEIAVADSFNHRISIFDGETGTFTRSIGSKGKTEDGTFSYPIAITADPNGNLVVLDTYTPRLQVFRYASAHYARYPSRLPILPVPVHYTLLPISPSSLCIPPLKVSSFFLLLLYGLAKMACIK